MYDEDRQTALTMYERMFDETADEQGLLQLLVSPTRQAVVLARSYDAKLRKLQIESRSQDENYMPDPEDVPSFIFVIDKTAQQAAELGVKNPAVSEDQFSIFESLEDAEQAEEAEHEPAAAETVAEESDESAEITVEEDVAEEPGTAPELDKAEEPQDEAEAEMTEPAEEVSAPVDEEADEEEISDVEETANAVDAFLADFSMENGELVPNKAETEPEEDKTVEAVEELPETEAAEAEEQAETTSRVKTNVFLLILYIFLAIPVGLAGVALLLIPAALFLVLAAIFAYVGVSTLGICFSSFAVIADTMLVFGAGLILTALSLLFIWLFIWFIVGAVFGFIRGICRLGRKICCKEVAVQ